MLTPRDYETLSGIFLFRGLRREEIAPLLASAEVLRVPSGATISDEGRRALGVVLSGSAEVRKRAGSGAMLLSVLERGAIFGAATLFGGADQPTEIRARGAVRVLLLPEEEFRAMLQADFRLTERYIGYLTGRIHFLNERLAGVLAPTAEERLLQFLAAQADETGRVQLGFSFTALAEALCISRASLYRALELLQQSGRVRREGRRTLFLTAAHPDSASNRDCDLNM